MYLTVASSARTFHIWHLTAPLLLPMWIRTTVGGFEVDSLTLEPETKQAGNYNGVRFKLWGSWTTDSMCQCCFGDKVPRTSIEFKWIRFSWVEQLQHYGYIAQVPMSRWRASSLLDKDIQVPWRALSFARQCILDKVCKIRSWPYVLVLTKATRLGDFYRARIFSQLWVAVQ